MPMTSTPTPTGQSNRHNLLPPGQPSPADGEQGDDAEFGDQDPYGDPHGGVGLEQADARGHQGQQRQQAACRIWPEACTIRHHSTPRGARWCTARCATQSASRLAAHRPPMRDRDVDHARPPAGVVRGVAGEHRERGQTGDRPVEPLAQHGDDMLDGREAPDVDGVSHRRALRHRRALQSPSGTEVNRPESSVSSSWLTIHSNPIVSGGVSPARSRRRGTSPTPRRVPPDARSAGSAGRLVHRGEPLPVHLLLHRMHCGSTELHARIAASARCGSVRPAWIRLSMRFGDRVRPGPPPRCYGHALRQWATSSRV